MTSAIWNYSSSSWRVSVLPAGDAIPYGSEVFVDCMSTIFQK